ncbi:hypothetical protein ACFFRE_08560, partial [Aciditerrimonas ferrireducens]
GHPNQGPPPLTGRPGPGGEQAAQASCAHRPAAPAASARTPAARWRRPIGLFSTTLSSTPARGRP